MSGYDTDPQYFSIERYNTRNSAAAAKGVPAEAQVVLPEVILRAPVPSEPVLAVPAEMKKPWLKSSTPIVGMNVPNWLLAIVLIVLTYHLIINLQERKVIPTILGLQTAILSTETPAAIRNITGGLY